MKIDISAKASLWYTLCSILQKACSMILIPLYVRLMSVDEYGIYTLFLSWEGIIMVFTTLNVANYAFNNCLIQNEDEKESITSSLLGFIYVLTFFWIIVFCIFSNFWPNIFGMDINYILLVAADSLFVVIIDLWMARQKFDFKYKNVVIITILGSLLKLAFGVYFVYYAQDKALVAILVYTLVQAFLALIISINIFYKGKKFFILKYWKYVILFNIPLIPHLLSTRILQQANRLIINKYCSVSDVAIYGFSSKITESMLIFNAAILSSLIPWTYRKIKNKEYSNINNSVFLSIVIIALLNLFLILLAPEVINILGTDEYKDAIYIIPPVALSVYFMYLFNVFVNVSYFYEANKLIMIVSVISAIINIVLNIFFIPYFGYMIAGYITLISYILLFVMHIFLYKYVCKKNNIFDNIYDLKTIIIFSLLFSVAGLLIIFLYDKTLIRYFISGSIILIIISLKNRLLNNYKNE